MRAQGETIRRRFSITGFRHRQGEQGQGNLLAIAHYIGVRLGSHGGGRQHRLCGHCGGNLYSIDDGLHGATQQFAKGFYWVGLGGFHLRQQRDGLGIILFREVGELLFALPACFLGTLQGSQFLLITLAFQCFG
ncbi:hypothetical protein D3C78_1064180 [compost metagenome]